MQQTLDVTRTSRNILKCLRTLEQLNKIRKDTNNLIWNIAHVVVVQQMLVYKLSEFYDDFQTKWLRNKKGSKPEHIATQARGR
jgi:hypothetical protein